MYFSENILEFYCIFTMRDNMGAGSREADKVKQIDNLIFFI